MPKRNKSLLPESFIGKILEEIGQSTTGPFANFELDLDERRVVWLYAEWRKLMAIGMETTASALPWLLLWLFAHLRLPLENGDLLCL